MNNFERFYESWQRRPRPYGDPQVATDPAWGGPSLERASEQNRVPDSTPTQPHQQPHSRPPGQPVGPDTRPAPPLPPVRR